MANEKRLIDANALSEKIGNMKNEITCNRGGYRYCDEDEKNEWDKLDGFDNLVCDAPTVDAVEVLRCKDCMWARAKDHREPTQTPGKLICQCFKHHYIPAPWGARMAVRPDDFCSYGEKREV